MSVLRDLTVLNKNPVKYKHSVSLLVFNIPYLLLFRFVCLFLCYKFELLECFSQGTLFKRKV